MNCIRFSCAIALVCGFTAAVGQPNTRWFQRHNLAPWELVFDHDHDGFTAEQEFAFGTDPLDTTSRPYGWKGTSNGLVLEFTLVPGIAHELETSTDLAQFQPVDIGSLPTNQTGNIEFPAVDTQRFFRFGAPPHPDTDGDCLLDFEELTIYGTDPLRVDTDGDGISDCEEVTRFGSDPAYASPAGRGRITGKVVFDSDADPETRDHSGLADWLVYLDLDGDGRRGWFEPVAASDAAGEFLFEELDPGTYRVRLELRPAWLQVFPALSPPLSPDGFPDRVERFDDAGTGPIAGPYGKLASVQPGRTILVGPKPEPVPLEVILGPIPKAPLAPPIGAWTDVDWLTVSSNSLVVVEFTAEEIFDGPGPDFSVASLSGTGGEPAEVYAGETPDHLVLVEQITEDVDLAIDLAEVGMSGPVYYVGLRALDNAGTFPGFDLCGFQALNYRIRSRAHYDVAVGGGQTTAGVDFGVAGDDRAPTILVSASPARPRAGQVVEVTVTAADDVGVQAVTLLADGVGVLLGTNRTVALQPPGPGIFELAATATDTAGQSASTSLPLLVANPDGSLPDLSGLGLEEPPTDGAPIIRVTSPVPGQILDTAVDLVGSILPGDLPLASWQVHIALADLVDPERLGDEDPDYVLLAQGREAVRGARLATLPVDGLPAGAYLLRFTATGGATTRQAFAVGVGIEPADIRPTITLTAPATGGSVSYLTEIRGSITTRQALREWSVEYAPGVQVNLENLGAAGPQWVRIAQGTNPVVDGVLAVFDPTVLPNDNYVVRVTAWNRNGLGWTEPLPLEVVGAAKLGNFAVQFTDLDLPLAGIPIRLTRVYDSLNRDRLGDFGYGWSLALQDADLRETIPNRGTGLVPTPFRVGTRVYLNAPDGRRIGFTFNPQFGAASILGAAYRVAFDPDPGVDSTLEVPEGNQAFLTLDASGQTYLFFLPLPYNPDTYILTDAQGTRYTYHERDGLREIEDRSGNRLTFSDTAIQHSAGPRVTLVRDVLGRITEVGGPEGAWLRYGYDAAGDLVSVTYPSGILGGFVYSDSRPHFLQQIDDPQQGPTQRIEYDAAGRVAAVIDAEGNRVAQAWDPAAFTGTLTDARGGVTQLTYDARGNIVREVNPLGGVTAREYGDARNPARETAVVDPAGRRTTFTYDERGNRLTELRPGARRATRWTYDSANGITQVAYPNSQVENRGYDSAGRLTELAAVSRTYRLSHTASGLPSTYTDPEGFTTRFEYDGSSTRPARVYLPNGAVQHFEYTSRGQLRRIIDPTGATNEFEYDTSGRPFRQLDPVGGSTVLTFHTNRPGAVATRTDRVGRITRFDYNRRGRLTSIEAPDGSTVRAEFDPNGNRTAVIDPLTNRFEFVYDALDRLLAEVDPYGRSRQHRYDAAGNRVETVDRNGRKRTFLYDDLDRLMEERWHDLDDTVLVTNRWAYEPNGRITSLTSPDATIRLGYFGETATIANEWAVYPGQPERLTGFGRDNAGRLATVNHVGNAIRFTRYADGGLGTAAINVGGNNYQVDLARNARGEITRIDRRRLGSPAVLAASTVFEDIDPRGWLNRFEHFLGTNEPVGAEFAFSRDAQGEILSLTSGGMAAALHYDSKGQLTGVEQDGATTETYGYDANGNRTSSHRHALYITDAGNRVTRAGDWQYEYDGEGNRIRKFNASESWHYDYDHRNRLARVWHASGLGPLVTVAEYRYDLLDRRIATIWNGVTHWTYYAFDNPLVDYVGTNTTPAAFYFHGERTDDLLAVWRPNEGLFWPLTDQVGTIRRVVSEEGQEVARYDYDSFGNLLSASGTQPDAAGRFGFVSRELEADLGLIWMRARWYDPDLGRFLSEDPLGFGGRDANLYRYAANRPLRHRDPTGNVTAIEYTWLAEFLDFGLLLTELCDLGKEVNTLWTFVANSVQGAIEGRGGPGYTELNDALKNSLPDACDLVPVVNPGCAGFCD